MFETYHALCNKCGNKFSQGSVFPRRCWKCDNPSLAILSEMSETKFVTIYSDAHDGESLRFWDTEELALKDACRLILLCLNSSTLQARESLKENELMPLLEEGTVSALRKALHTFQQSKGYGDLEWCVGVRQEEVVPNPVVPSWLSFDTSLNDAKIRRNAGG